MEIRVRSCKEVAVLGLEGVMDRPALDDLLETVETGIHAGCHSIVLDLAGVKVIASLGIHAFVEIHDRVHETYDRARGTRGRLILAAVPVELETILRAAQLTSFFETAESADEALGMLGISRSNLISGFFGQKTVRRRSARLEPVDPVASPVRRRSAKRPKTPDRLDDAQLQRLVRRFVPGRVALQILDYYVSRSHSIAEPEQIAKVLGKPPEMILKMMKRLARRGILHSLGGETYNYAPDEETCERMKAFFAMWHSSQDHARILTLVLEQE